MTNRPDYDFSKHVKVPDEWIERALAVTAAQQAEPRRFSQRSRRIAAAAGVVLVLGLSISIYFVIRNINDVADIVAPSAEPTASASTDMPPAPTNAAVMVQPTEPPTVSEPDTEAPSDALSQASVSPTSPGQMNAVSNPTEAPTDASPNTPTESSEPPTQPATAPVVIPTEPATIPPEPSTVPPTEPNIMPPTDDPTPAAECDIEVFIPFALPIYQTSESDADETIYCRIYNEAGALVGESDWYAPSHIAQMLWIERTPYLYYTQSLPANAYTDAAGQYQYVFYDSVGKTLAYGYC